MASSSAVQQKLTLAPTVPTQEIGSILASIATDKMQHTALFLPTGSAHLMNGTKLPDNLEILSNTDVARQRLEWEISVFTFGYSDLRHQ